MLLTTEYILYDRQPQITYIRTPDKGFGTVCESESESQFLQTRQKRLRIKSNNQETSETIVWNTCTHTEFKKQ